MSDAPPADPALSEGAFEARYGPRALFSAYSGARRRQLAMRQVATVLGAALLWLLVSPVAALAAIALALVGEAVEIAALSHVLRRLDAGATMRALRPWIGLGAGLQALTICICVQILLIGAPDPQVQMLALCFLMGAGLNAALVLSHDPFGARIKLGLYGACALLHLGFDLWRNAGFAEHQVYTLLQIAMLGFMVYSFAGFAHQAWHRRLMKERALIDGAQRLARLNANLAETQREARELSQVARQANDSVIITDENGIIRWVNAAFTRLTGYEFDEAVGRGPADLLDGPDSDPDMAAKVIAARRAGRALRAEVLNYSKDGRKIWFDINLVPIRNPDGTLEGFISIERDVTEAKRQEAELAEAKTRAEAAVRAKSVFLATMSHEIRTPLNAIIGMSDLLSEADLDGTHRSYVDTIRQSSEALLKIINDILDLSRLDADKLILEAEPFSLASCLRGAVDLLRPMARDKGLYLDVTHDTRLPDRVRADPGRLRQVLVNLLSNAVKFTQTGGVTVNVAVHPSDAGWELTVLVRDTGIGVPPDRADAIFEEFEQAEAATTRKFGGTGLGLPISRALARRMGGDLEFVPPDKGPGSAFRVTVQLGRVAPGEVDSDDHEIDAPRTVPALHVLLAEDNATNRLLVARFLQDQPITLTMAENGRRAVEIAQETHPDVVLMDMSMPELDGLEATRTIRATRMPQPHIVALTANAFASDRAACAEAGMDDFLTKPVRKRDLIAALLRAAEGEKPLSRGFGNDVSGAGAAERGRSWTSPPGSGTTNGKSIRSSGR